jgi:ectoine hydroxylase
VYHPSTRRPRQTNDAVAAHRASEAEAIYATSRQEVWWEKTGAPRTAFAAHTYHEAFRLLGHHPRLIGPVEQVFGEKLYMHQYKINAKAAFEGDVWQWHQDYGTWARDDGMPEPRAMNIAVFMDEVMPINGPLMLCRKAISMAYCRPGTTRRRPPTHCGRSTMRP